LPDNNQRTDYAQALIALLHAIEPLKHLPRSGWVDREVSSPESVAAHSWRLALFAWCVATEEGLDADRAMRLAMIHDIPEALTGDRTPFDYLAEVSERRRLAANPAERSAAIEADARATKHALEREAMAQIVAHAPTFPAKALASLWEEYAAESSPEAQLVHQLDKLEAYLQGSEYAEDGRLAEPLTLRSFRDDSGRMATVPAARALFKAIENWARAGSGLMPEDAIKPEL
jgi:putative hydrolases of HD superfamily